MGYLWAVRAAFIYHWRILSAGAGYLTGVIGVAPYAIAVAWMAAANGDPSVVLHISAGVFLMFCWNFSVARIGFSLQNEMGNGTLELSLVSRTPLMIVQLGKALAVVAFAPLTGLVGFVAVVIVSQSLPHSPNPAAVLVSVGVGMVAILGVGFLSAPIAVLTRGGTGYGELWRPGLVILSGLLFPVSMLRSELQVLVGFVPTSWAANGLRLSLGGTGYGGSFIENWAATLALSLAYLGITYFIFKAVERRVIRTATLSTF